MIDWPPDVPRPSVEQIRAAILAHVAPDRKAWPVSSERSFIAGFMRQLCAGVARDVLHMRADELAEACGYRAHSSIYQPGRTAAMCESPAGIAMRSAVLYRLVREQREQMRAMPSRVEQTAEERRRDYSERMRQISRDAMRKRVVAFPDARNRRGER
jgi:hypothetical protein